MTSNNFCDTLFPNWDFNYLYANVENLFPLNLKQKTSNLIKNDIKLNSMTAIVINDKNAPNENKTKRKKKKKNEY